MSDTSSLTELARFVGQSALASEDEPTRQRTINGIVGRLQPQRRGVGDLLGVVLVLSARTRRMVLPRIEVDLDVFTPEGQRAARILLPRPHPA